MAGQLLPHIEQGVHVGVQAGGDRHQRRRVLRRGGGGQVGHGGDRGAVAAGEAEGGGAVGGAAGTGQSAEIRPRSRGAVDRGDLREQAVLQVELLRERAGE